MLKYIPIGFLLATASADAQDDKNKREGVSSIEISPQQEMLREETLINQFLPLIKEKAAKKEPLACFQLASFYHAQAPDDHTQEIVQLYTIAAEAKHMDSCYILGMAFYHEDWGLKRTDVRLVKYLTEAAARGNGEAVSYLALAYWHGFGGEKDINAAIKWLDKAVELDHAMGLCVYGTLLRSKKDIEADYPRAKQYFERAVAKECAYAMTQLGIMHQFGEGCEKNVTEAIRLYRQAITTEADQDQAMLNLGMLYFEGTEVAQDIEAAQYYLGLSADLGDRDAQRVMGTALVKGESLEKRTYAGLTYLAKAAAQGDERARSLLDVESDSLTVSADSGDKEAQRVLGICLMDGTIFEENTLLGLRYVWRAAEQGDELANQLLEEIEKISCLY
ncbi:tetratricopeptide repeat protein [Candidatus Odyssella acanthamoebae]|uniref:Beta-lactamase n=1 Tax=Candidatus Odyssella acanthamoebae TaxID=91604 RepID=A0A077AXG2_9PROT|nr:tetratricopeptide repeat protein [Candidatus Paracaedibacter acanthamoebae]AIK96679.1 hypothetical protein ID47_08025 [Candidatus Paracaedibacter acanthamoebae]